MTRPRPAIFAADQRPERAATMRTFSTENWQKDYASAVRNPRDLLRMLELPEEILPLDSVAAREFPLRVPLSYVARMQPGDLHDPLLRQVLPLAAENLTVPGFTKDAVGDTESRVAPGLLAKYPGRALLISTGQCAVHCRYCFRRHYPYDDEPRSHIDWEDAFRDITNATDLREAILSGGDPLMLGNSRLAMILQRLAEIGHLRRVRIHSRLPVVLPSRCTPELLDLLTSTRLTCVFVVHANHAQELTGDCAEAVDRMVSAGLLVLNQAVLLRGVNDNADALVALSERLIELGVRPYYLHQLDRVAGTAHFEVPEDEGRQIMHEVRCRLPGYAVPQYVREQAGAPYKLPIV